jgi:chorismate mutase
MISFYVMRPLAIRGATTVISNNPEEIKQASLEVIRQIVTLNNISQEDIIMVFGTMTSDLTAYNASAAIRQGMNWNDVPFFTSQEPTIDGMLPRCIRVLVQIYSDKSKSEIQHVYLNDAIKLRPDLNK